MFTAMINVQAASKIRCIQVSLIGTNVTGWYTCYYFDDNKVLLVASVLELIIDTLLHL